jgi:hypothetical protein
VLTNFSGPGDGLGELVAFSLGDGRLGVGIADARQGDRWLVRWGDCERWIDFADLAFVPKHYALPSAGLLVGQTFDSVDEVRTAFIPHLRPGAVRGGAQ